MYHNNHICHFLKFLFEITFNIILYRRDIWKNSTFSSKLIKSQSEEIYMTNVIVPMIRASLKDLLIRKSGYISTAERQSIASKDREKLKNDQMLYLSLVVIIGHMN